MRPPERGLGGLSIAIGMHVAQALKDMGVEKVGLKWPNDLLLDGSKVAGILVEVASARQDRVRLVAGIGINLYLNEADVERIGYEPAVLGRAMSRNELAGRVMGGVIEAFGRFEQHGLSPMVQGWEVLDEYLGCPVNISVAESKVSGIDRGIDEEGNLLLETDEGTRRFNAGEVSLRPL
jgi:BirA family biotin operon repressor/biotin-[acetyl-CoA-carboxylase] ligase